MVGSSREADSRSLFKELIRSQEKRDEEIGKRARAFLRSKNIPTPDDLREAINSCVGDRRQELLRHHVYWKERQLRLGLESLIRAAHQAYVDICRHDAALGSLARARDFEDHVDHTIGYAAQKDMVAYCSLGVGVLDTLRRIKKTRPDIKDQIRRISNECFDHNVTAFIKCLRINLFHGSVVIPKWEISYDWQGQDSSGAMTYEKQELLGFGDWNAKSKEYVSDVTDGRINLASVVREHFNLLNAFDREQQDLFARNVSAAEKDFFEIEDSHKRIRRRQCATILISQIGKDKDPYEYLHRFFDPETVREILRLPRHSKKQVDFIIALKAAELDVDDDLRCLLYAKFGVEDNLST